MSDTFGYGQQLPSDMASNHNVLEFIIQKLLGRIRTAVPVKVISVVLGGVGPAGVVAVQPIVNMLDGIGNSMQHGTIMNVPYSRIQGGINAVIMDPSVNDIGVMLVCDRDISSAQSSGWQISNPGSTREFDLADGIYIAGLSNMIPTQYVEFLPGPIGGINIVSLTNVSITAPGGLIVNGTPVSLP
jgi:hypothetical protein